jgi:2-polyprenyl-3-methyl-5-hydroxy-6-metoxy-1,4-benzoquinol methylase
MSFKVLTEYPVATTSPDYIHPHGTMRDNHTSIPFIEEVVTHHFGDRKIYVMDLGCSGGQLIKDFYDLGHFAIGLEGSDYSAKIGRACWEEGYNKYLFTCDCAKPYQILFDENSVLFDLITAWEVIEHIHPDELDQFFLNIYNHLKDDGFFVGSISTKNEIIEGVVLHQSVFDENKWKTEILTKYFTVYPYPLKHKVREDGGNFFIMLKKK